MLKQEKIRKKCLFSDPVCSVLHSQTRRVGWLNEDFCYNNAGFDDNELNYFRIVRPSRNPEHVAKQDEMIFLGFLFSMLFFIFLLCFSSGRFLLFC